MIVLETVYDYHMNQEISQRSRKYYPFQAPGLNASNHRNHLKYNAWQGEKTTGKHTGKEHINTGSYLETIF